jgi:hypothetical protein
METYRKVEGVFALIEAVSEEIDSIAPDLATPENTVTVLGYGSLYELPVGQLGAFVFRSLGLWGRVIQISKSEDPNTELLAVAQEDLPLAQI